MSEHTHDADHGPRHYIKIWFLLVVLAAISIAGPEVAKIIGLSSTSALIFTLITAFGIAFFKAYLVIKHFMHLIDEPRWVLYLFGGMLCFMVIFFTGTSPDVRNHSGANWENVAAQNEVKRVQAIIAEEAKHGGVHGEDHGKEHAPTH